MKMAAVKAIDNWVESNFAIDEDYLEELKTKNMALDQLMGIKTFKHSVNDLQRVGRCGGLTFATNASVSLQKEVIAVLMEIGS
jgi:hypothetical protein